MDCTHRCQRLHGHCTLTLSRCVAPDHYWHWCVTMPDGHIYEISKGSMSFERALEDMRLSGVEALLAADARWREDYICTSEQPE